MPLCLHIARLLGAAVLAAMLMVLARTPAAALTADQVIALRKAGISNELIVKMIESEMEAQARGGIGKYVIKQKDGGETIVYRASTPRGVVDYPLEGIAAPGVDRMGVVLGIDKREYPATGKPAPAQAKPGAKASKQRRYTLHIASFRKEPYAQKQLAALKSKGVKARVQMVDLPGKGRWYRLLAGDFATKTQARAQGDLLLRTKSIESFKIMPR